MKINSELKMSAVDLTPIQKIKVMTVERGISINDETEQHDFREGPYVLSIANYAVATVYLEGKEPYDRLFVFTDDGLLYTSSSSSLINALDMTRDAMDAVGLTFPQAFAIYRVKSKKYSGKDFLTATLIG